ncbi:MAG: 4-hydroxy-3-methylbut-2-enyl diphosphate reductase [Deltaproteobacteria bacterium]|nr:4-hydroxy-3-methylbut-2-enyl diphosphate reductase [Deltaproteobacteria bacterium]RLB31209.1 MAG: 4-hydroxy-3-methylbut-2-enyl diphosphate reductase [Deltaproteobacteria bacterium]
MKVKLARMAGFCMGVRRALEMVLAAANRGDGPLYTLGPLIHNRQVMELLESKGVKPVEDVSEIKNGILVLRAHGIPPQDRKRIKDSGLALIDATCPRVARVQSIIRYHTRRGYSAVIVGEEDHPEVIGLMGYGNDRTFVISNPSQVELLPPDGKLIVVAQTTQEKQNYDQIAQRIKERVPGAIVFDTICDATLNRQHEVRSLAPYVDAMVVVGGYHSGNTRRLAQVSRSTGIPTFHVETEKDLDKTKLASLEVIGVTAGASTPNWMIKNVVRELESIRTRRDSRLVRWSRTAIRGLLQTNILVAAGAFSLSYAAAILAGRKPDFLHPLIAALYIYAMHALNRLLDKGASTYNDPERASFYRRYRAPLVLSGISSIAGALVLSYILGFRVFLAVLGLSVLGTIYSVPLLPRGSKKAWRYYKIKDIPGSKTLSQALAWGALIALVPTLESANPGWGVAIISFCYIFSIVYVRSALFDIFQAQGDLIVGAETLPITLGERRTLVLLKVFVLFAAAVLALAALIRAAGGFSFFLLLSCLYLGLCVLAYEKRWLYPGPRLEALVEGNLLLIGLLALSWQLIT